MALAASATQLGCGRDIDDVWDHLDRAPDRHEQTCPFCQDARADLGDLATITRDLRARQTSGQEPGPSPHVLDQIMAVARAEVRRGRRLPLDRPGPDQTSVNTVSEQAVTAVVRRTGDRQRRIQVRRCTIQIAKIADVKSDEQASASAQPTTAQPTGLDEAGGAGAELRPVSVSVSLRVSVGQGLDILAAVRGLSDEVVAAIRQEVGLDVSRVDVRVEDVHDA